MGAHVNTGVLPVGSATWCIACGGAILWATSDSGRRIPVDAQLALDGRLVLWFWVDGLHHPTDEVQRVRLAEPDYIGPRWSSHWAVCPKAPTFRRIEAARGGAL
jgi:hypothetical protein